MSREKGGASGQGDAARSSSAHQATDRSQNCNAVRRNLVYLALRCPDCTAKGTAAAGIAHDHTCPIGRGIERTNVTDWAWFTAHPAAPARWRQLYDAEHHEVRLLGIDPGRGRWRVQVCNVGHRRMARRFVLEGALAATVEDQL